MLEEPATTLQLPQRPTLTPSLIAAVPTSEGNKEMSRVAANKVSCFFLWSLQNAVCHKCSERRHFGNVCRSKFSVPDNESSRYLLVEAPTSYILTVHHGSACAPHHPEDLLRWLHPFSFRPLWVIVCEPGYAKQQVIPF